MSKRLGWIGVLITVVYLLCWSWLVYHRAGTFKDMELNEIGDFLGGSFGPLAFLWLVLGFFQQGIELRQNSLALRLQADELKNSVEQQKRMADAAAARQEQVAAQLTEARSTLDVQRRKSEKQRLQPRFHIEKKIAKYLEDSVSTFILENSGHDCRDVLITAKPTAGLALEEDIKFDSFKSHETQDIEFVWGGVDDSMPFMLQYTDAEGETFQEFYIVRAQGGYLSVDSAPRLKSL